MSTLNGWLMPLDLGLECYRAKGVVEHHWLAGPDWQFTESDRGKHSRRTFVALHVFDLLTAPIPGLDEALSAVSEGALTRDRLLCMEICRLTERPNTRHVPAKV